MSPENKARIKELLTNYSFPLWEGKYKPMKHQLLTVGFITTYNRCYVLNEQRTGKTASTLWGADYLMKTGKIKNVVILCTKSCVNSVLGEAITSTFPTRTWVGVLGTAKQRQQKVLAAPEFLIANHDGIKIKSVQAALNKVITKDTLIIIDEMTAFGTPTSQRTKIATKMCDKAGYVWGLTGTPFVSGAKKVWSMCNMVTPWTVPDSYHKWQAITQYKVNNTFWTDRADWKEHGLKAMQPAIRFELKDIVEIPEVQHLYRSTDLNKNQNKVIKFLREEGGMYLASGAELTAANAGVLISKVKQAASGFVYAQDKKKDQIIIDLKAEERIQTVIDLINETQNKVLIFGSYTGVLHILRDAVSKHFNCVYIDGSVTGKHRDKAIHDFMHNPSYQVLIAHPNVVAHGLEFSVADTIIWYTNPPSSEIYSQANKRPASAKQKNKVGIYHLYSTKIELQGFHKYDNLGRSQNEALDTINIFKDFVRGD